MGKTTHESDTKNHLKCRLPSVSHSQAGHSNAPERLMSNTGKKLISMPKLWGVGDGVERMHYMIRII